jgi:hypothetical protein
MAAIDLASQLLPASMNGSVAGFDDTNHTEWMNLGRLLAPSGSLNFFEFA